MGKRHLSERSKIQSEIGLWSGLFFSILGALICTILFSGESRTFGQLVSVTIGGTVANSPWWRNKPINLHILVMIIMPFLVLLAALRAQIIQLIKQNLARVR